MHLARHKTVQLQKCSMDQIYSWQEASPQETFNNLLEQKLKWNLLNVLWIQLGMLHWKHTNIEGSWHKFALSSFSLYMLLQSLLQCLMCYHWHLVTKCYAFCTISGECCHVLFNMSADSPHGIWGGWGCEVSCGGHHWLRGKATTGSALDGAVLDFTQILADRVHSMSRSQLYLGFGNFGWLTSFFRSITLWRDYG